MKIITDFIKAKKMLFYFNREVMSKQEIIDVALMNEKEFKYYFNENMPQGIVFK